MSDQTLHHGMKPQRGMNKRATGSADPRRFADLFPNLPRMITDPRILEELGELGGAMDEAGGGVGDTTTPLGFVFFGQFIDHDMTLDVTSSFNRVNDPDAIRNFRTPTLDLDCIYGNGLEASPYLYYHAPPGASDFQRSIDMRHLLTNEDDLVRALSESETNPHRIALIGDPRNDENRVISQLQLAMHRFHNAVVDYIVSEGKYEGPEVLEEAQRLTRWHYQWVVVHDFLVRMVGQKLVDDILCNGGKVYPQAAESLGGPFMPTEFAVAAFRFGHTMVREPFAYNDTHNEVELFGPELGGGFRANEAGKIDWSKMFGNTAQAAGSVDTKLPSGLLDLPFVREGDVKSLASRNLLRSQSFGLPSGQSVHKALSEACGEVLPSPDLGNADLKLPQNIQDCTPLWLYILAEGTLTGGQRLGPVGGRIVAETIIGLLELDNTSYLGANRSWRPNPEFIGENDDWDMVALLKFAGVL